MVPWPDTIRPKIPFLLLRIAFILLLFPEKCRMLWCPFGAAEVDIEQHMAEIGNFRRGRIGFLKSQGGSWVSTRFSYALNRKFLDLQKHMEPEERRDLFWPQIGHDASLYSVVDSWGPLIVLQVEHRSQSVAHDRRWGADLGNTANHNLRLKTVCVAHQAISPAWLCIRGEATQAPRSLEREKEGGISPPVSWELILRNQNPPRSHISRYVFLSILFHQSAEPFLP